MQDILKTERAKQPGSTPLQLEKTKTSTPTSMGSRRPVNRRLLVVVGASLLILASALGLWYMLSRNTTAPSSNETVANYQRRLPELKQHVQNNPNDAVARKNYGVALYATGDLNGAREQYETAIKLNPKDATIYNTLGNTYRDLGQTEKAIAAYKQSLQLNDKAINAYANLANIQLYVQKKPADAIATYQQGLRAMPNNSQLQLLLGIAYEADGNTSKAREIYQSILSHDPDNAAAKSNLTRLESKE